MQELFTECCAFIAGAVREGRHEAGSRFLLCPKANFSEAAKIWLLSISPAGDHADPRLPAESCESGAAIYTEYWNKTHDGLNRLQTQERLLYAKIQAAAEVGGSTEYFAATAVLSAYYCPFRFADGAARDRSPFAKRKSAELWTKILRRHTPPRLITLGRMPYEGITSILRELGFQEEAVREIALTGAPELRIHDFRKDDSFVRLGYLPHPSRYAIMGEHCKNADGVAEFIEKMEFAKA